MKKLLCLLLSLLLLCTAFSGCAKNDDTPASDTPDQSASVPDTTESAPAGEPSLIPAGAAEPFTTNDNARVFYEIFVGSFSDSNGDGIGDLRGIINRMDYLNDGDDTSGKSLGIEGIWLSPIFTSPSYHKYDAVNYYAVDTSFGTVDDLKELVNLCHERNVKVILDLAINHTSRLSSWFVQFCEAHKNNDPSDPYYEFYTYVKDGEAKPAGRVFSKISGSGDYYECNFDTSMPELNYDNPAVREAVLDVARYWMTDVGVDGFRFDAAKYIYFGDHEKSVEFWQWYIAELKAINPEVYTVAEVWDGDNITAKYYPALNCFNFTTSQGEGLIAATAGGGDVNRFTAYVDGYLDAIQALREDAMYVPFIANHDNDRAAGYLPTMNGRAYMGANILLLTPGSPFMYYGEEIGLRGSRGSANTDANRRLAMYWGDGDTIKDPQGTTYAADNRADATVAEQILDPNSLYSYYKQVIQIRKANPEIARGEFTPVTVPDSKVGGFASTWNGKTVVVLHNTTTKEQTLDLKTLGLDAYGLHGAIGLNGASVDGTTLTIGAQTSVILR